jgi:hypothetical protein
MTGWKSKLGGAGMIATGIGMVISGLLAQPMDGDMVFKGFAMVGGGITAIGIAHKIEKSGK